MTNSDTASSVISLPKGGGAIQGIGETFSPDLFTGTGNFSIPIAPPSGRNGFQPQLNIVYSTGNGNGPFGLGWNLSIPGVSRKKSKGIPVYDDTKDVFVLSGAEDLVPLESTEAEIRYRPRTEGLFARIIHHGPRHVWVRDAANEASGLREKLRYGDDQPAQANRRGRLTTFPIMRVSMSCWTTPTLPGVSSAKYPNLPPANRCPFASLWNQQDARNY